MFNRRLKRAAFLNILVGMVCMIRSGGCEISFVDRVINSEIDDSVKIEKLRAVIFEESCDLKVRIYAIDQIVQAGKAGHEALVLILENSTNSIVTHQAGSVLLQLEEESIAELEKSLQSVLLADCSQEKAYWVVSIILKMGSPRGEESLESIMEDVSPRHQRRIKALLKAEEQP